MRRGQIAVLIGVISGLLSVLLAVAVNVATGGRLPGPLDRVAWLAWPSVALLAVIGVGLAVWQQRLASVPTPSTVDSVGGPSELPLAGAVHSGRHPGGLGAARDRHRARPAGRRAEALESYEASIAQFERLRDRSWAAQMRGHHDRLRSGT